MVEINYDNGEYSFSHDERKWKEGELMEHLTNNGHGRIVVAFGISHREPEAYEYCSGIARDVEKIFEEKECRKNRRRFE